MPKELTPSERWAELKKTILAEISTIDHGTPWSEVEPDWWLEMTEVGRHIMDLPDSTVFWCRKQVDP